MRFEIHGKWRNIENLVWSEIPELAVVTGKNGVGKSNLLRLMAYKSNAQYFGPDRSTVDSIRRPSNAVNFEYRFVTEPENLGACIYAELPWPSLVQSNRSVNTSDVTNFFQSIPGRIASYQWGSNPVEDVIYDKAAANIGCNRDSLASVDLASLENAFDPYGLWYLKAGSSLQSLAQSIDFLCLLYSMMRSTLIRQGFDEASIASKLGEAPWSTLDKLMASADMPYRTKPPDNAKYSALAPGSFSLTFLDDLEGNELSVKMLSSGEQVLMSMSLWLFCAQAAQVELSLLLLDEPDANLHPSMIARFVNILLDHFVRDRGIRVIMTTHSPTTVALTPPGSLFVMHRANREKLVPANNEQALNILTEGFDTLQAGVDLLGKISGHKNILLTEGHNNILVRAALDLYGIKDVLVIDAIKGKSGCNQLGVLFDFLQVVRNSTRCIFLLDCDVRTQRKGNDALAWIEMERDCNNKFFARGIEASFPSQAFEEFITNMNGVDVVNKGNKKDYAVKIAAEKNPDYFRWFEPVASEIKEFLELARREP